MAMARGKNATEGTGGSFSYYELGEPLLLPSGNLEVNGWAPEKIGDYIWYTETKKPLPDHKNSSSYFLGENNSTAYYFFYEPQKVCVLNYDFVATIPEKRQRGYIISPTAAPPERTGVAAAAHYVQKDSP